MINKIKILTLGLCLISAAGQISLAQEAPLPPEITGTSCGIEEPCSEGLECFDFPEIGLRCAELDPCSYYDCSEDTQCVIAESYPPQVICSAQALIDAEVEEAINLDENVEPEDLEVGDPKLLPGHPLYFLKNWGRTIRSIFAFGSTSKAKLRLKFSNERLMELKKLIKESDDPDRIKVAIEAYQKEIEEIKNQVGKIKEKAEDDPKVEKFLDKFLHQQTLHQKLLSKLEGQVPTEVFERIRQARERHLERFQEVMLKLEQRQEEITKKLEETFENQEGSKYKNFKNLEILIELEEKVPEQAKDTIRKAQENALKRLKGDLEKMSPEDQEKFKEYLEKISGSTETHLEILENLKLELRNRLEITERIMGAENQVRERIMSKIEERVNVLNCPGVVKPVFNFCPSGRIVANKDEKGCIISFDCIVPDEIEIPVKPIEPGGCFALWDPVCGKNGKTYSNECFANLAGIEIAHKGRCEEDLICEEKCKSSGYKTGICRSWSVTPVVEWGCKNTEVSAGEASDCFVPPRIVGIGKACCCQE